MELIESENEKIARHKEICQLLDDTYIKKNHDYGDSFGQSYQDWGITSAAIRIQDKFNRFKNYAKNNEYYVEDESVIDTLFDMANYCIMTIMELEPEFGAK
jgi:hypothetical protein